MSRRARVAAASVVLALATAGSAAAALQALPPGAQVNDDPAAGINPALSVSGEDPTNADVVGGALTAGGKAVPWAVFRQTESEGAHDQIFSRSFANGVWKTRGSGTVGGRSSAGPTFPGSLNFDQGQDGEAPAIDFAGTGRTVPWATWYENTTGTGFGANNIFASRFDATTGKWIFAGQSRGNGGTGPGVPSLNIHTDKSAENPSVAGGSAVDPTKPGPWVTWQEKGANAPGVDKDQIFVSKPLGPGMTNCDTVTPKGDSSAGDIPAIGGFCFQQVGVERLGTDPSLNVDLTRDGVEPDIAFTGANDSVPWVVWYEQNPTGTTGANKLGDNEMVFAAKGVAPSATAPPSGTVDGGFNWIAVGNNAQGTLDTTNRCGANLDNEHACALNLDPTKDAEDPRVAAGTMNPANPTVPWVAWDETVGSSHKIFVSRLVGAGAAARFQPVNGGQPISSGSGDATRPDITFSGNTPYVTWRQQVNGVSEGFAGHFVNAANPTFVLDQSNIPLTPTGDGAGQANVREPISSSCIATPFNADGKACQGSAIGTPFFLFTNGTNPLRLFSSAYAPDAPVTGTASGVTTSAATLNATDNPMGASLNASFQFGTTTAYGSSTAVQELGPTSAATPFSAQLTGLPSGTTIHYRAVVTSDFGTFVGADQTLTTALPTPPPPPPPAGSGHASIGHVTVTGNTASVPVSCTGSTGQACDVTLTMTVAETLRGHKVIAITSRKQAQKHRKVVVVGSAHVRLTAGQTKVVRLTLNRAGKALLAQHHTLNATLHGVQTLASHHTVTVAGRTLTFRAPKHHQH
ncbi:MAG: hypothetical protein ACXVVQ_01275 [Solirubrobacteraceae bacterium]